MDAQNKKVLDVTMGLLAYLAYKNNSELYLRT